MAEQYPFLSTDWMDAAKRIRDEMPHPEVPSVGLMKMNLVVTASPVRRRRHQGPRRHLRRRDHRRARPPRRPRPHRHRRVRHGQGALRRPRRHRRHAGVHGRQGQGAGRHHQAHGPQRRPGAGRAEPPDEQGRAAIAKAIRDITESLRPVAALRRGAPLRRVGRAAVSARGGACGATKPAATAAARATPQPTSRRWRSERAPWPASAAACTVSRICMPATTPTWLIVCEAAPATPRSLLVDRRWRRWRSSPGRTRPCRCPTGRGRPRSTTARLPAVTMARPDHRQRPAPASRTRRSARSPTGSPR